MTVLCIILAVWAAFATYGWLHNYRAGESWRIQYMIARGCDTQETRKWMSGTK